MNDFPEQFVNCFLVKVAFEVYLLVQAGRFLVPRLFPMILM